MLWQKYKKQTIKYMPILSFVFPLIEVLRKRQIIQKYKNQQLQKNLIKLQEIKVTDENYEDVLSHVNSLLKYKE